jgi:type IV pilus assembly protein PilM
VAVQHGRPVSRLVGVRSEKISGQLQLSSRQPNVKDPRHFVDALRRLLDPLAAREERIALSLPDRVGRVYLLDAEAPFKSHQEGIDILKWRLKANLPAAAALVQLDYQILERREDGRLRCLAAAIAKPVLEQYEELVLAAGRHAAQIEFHSQSLFNYYRPRLDLGEEFLLIVVERELLALMYVAGRILAYHRVREVSPEPELIFRELSRTIVEAAASHSSLQRCPVFVHLDPDLDMPICDVLTATTEREVRILDPQLKRFAGVASLNLSPAGTTLAALGAAERLINP